jgi:hypothetical protein
MKRCGQDITFVEEVSAVDSFYIQRIRKSPSKAIGRIRQQNGSGGAVVANTIAPRADFGRFAHRLVQARQKILARNASGAWRTSSNCRIGESPARFAQKTMSAFCSVTFDLYSRRLFCHSNHRPWIGSRGVWGDGKS